MHCNEFKSSYMIISLFENNLFVIISQTQNLQNPKSKYLFELRFVLSACLFLINELELLQNFLSLWFGTFAFVAGFWLPPSDGRAC